MKNNWDKILLELSYRVSSGIPDLTNEQHLMKLWDILKEHNWSVDARVELLKNLNEVSIVKNKKSGNTYVVKNHNPDTQDLVKKDASDDEIAKMTKDKVDKEKDDKEPEDKQKRIINGKDKTLKKVNTSDTETFSQGIEPDDDDYSNDLEIGEST